MSVMWLSDLKICKNTRIWFPKEITRISRSFQGFVNPKRYQVDDSLPKNI